MDNTSTTSLADKRAFIGAILHQQTLCTISTINDRGEPQSAVVGFGETPELQIIFGTENTTRKYHNLQARPNVAMVLAWTNGQTVQLEGVARELTTAELPQVEQYLWAKNPYAKKYHQNPNQRYFIITPTWVRYSDIKQDPWNIITLNFSEQS